MIPQRRRGRRPETGSGRRAVPCVGRARTNTDDHGLSRTRRSVSVGACPCRAVRTRVLPRDPVAGFTLLELLVAMTLMAVVGSSLYTALHTGFRAHRSALLAVEPTAQAINAVELLKQDILGVLPPGSGLAGAFIGTDSTGIQGVDADSLEFYTTHIYADEEQLIGGLGRVELLLEENTQDEHENCATYRLLRQVTTNLLAPKDVEPREQVLCRNITSMNLRYYDGDGWLDDWDSTADANSLPKAVEIDIEIACFGKNGRNNRNTPKEPEKRRLIQCFAIPCRTAETASNETTTNGATSGEAAR